MLLKQVVLHNFGGYRGRQMADLTPPGPNRPVILFGGLNGAGKTTLLDGLQLGLYGKRARCAGRGASSYDEYLRRSINRGAPATEGAGIELHFEAAFEGVSSSFQLSRTWQCFESGAVRERLTVILNEQDSPMLAQRWDEFVEEILPLEISSLFFFDGEKIEALADPGRAGRVIETAVDSLLGLSLLDRLSVDLVALERRKRSTVADADTKERIAKSEAALVESEARRLSRLQEQASRQNEVDRAERDLNAAEAAFRREGGELFEQRKELESRRENLSAQVEELEARLIEVASGSLPLRIVPDLLARVSTQRETEIEADRARLLSDVLAERDGELMNQFSDVLDPSLAAEIDHFLSVDRKRRTRAGRSPKRLPANDGLDARLAIVWPSELERAAGTASDLLRRRQEVLGDLEEIDRLLAAVPAADAIGRIAQDREERRQGLREAQLRLAVSGEMLEEASEEATKLADALERLYREAANTSAAAEDAERIVEHANRVRGTLTTFRSALLERHVSSIEAGILDSFKRLLRKQNLVADLRLDPSTFELTLFDRRGELLPPERLSAGERQLLAIAILWGLARVSGRQLPMVIDTPLGRLDSSHRRLIAERYFPSASHQVVLLSTDEEIDESLLGVLAPFIGRSYELRHDDVSGATAITEGYFWEEATDVA